MLDGALYIPPPPTPYPPSCLSLCLTTLIPHDYTSRKGWLVRVAYDLKHSLFNLTNELWMRRCRPRTNIYGTVMLSRCCNSTV